MVGNQNQVQKNSFAKYIIIPIICLFIAGYMLRSRMTHAKRTGEKLGQKTTTQNIKETTTLKKQKLKKNNKRKKRETRLINTNDKNWISVSTIKVNNKIKYIVHPVTNELYPKNLFPYDLTYTSSSVWANVPTNQLSKNKNFVSDNRTHKTFFSPEQKITTN
ncbi:MAG: hypothetical protein GY870_16915 [archaeon]|nr:hypothetical protein [archaeon]